MTTETERPTFRGVVCLHCKTPIPVPAIVGGSESDSNGTDFSARKSQVFNLRCPACLKEKPYRTREIVDFEGIPETSPTFERLSPVGWYPNGGNVRAAKA